MKSCTRNETALAFNPTGAKSTFMLLCNQDLTMPKNEPGNLLGGKDSMVLKSLILLDMTSQVGEHSVNNLAIWMPKHLQASISVLQFATTPFCADLHVRNIINIIQNGFHSTLSTFITVIPSYTSLKALRHASCQQQQQHAPRELSECASHNRQI